MTKKIPDKWRKLFALIPGGYDPEATAGECEFDDGVADRVCRFFPEFLTHIESGQRVKASDPFVLEPWQRAIVGCAFGWKRPDGTRRYREVFQYIPRKNGKTTMIGGLINLIAFCDDEQGAQIYSAAADKDQAVLVFRQTKGMIMNNPQLEEGVKIHHTYKSIEYPGGSIYKALSAEADTKHGFNSHFIVIDELHAQPNRELVDVLLTSTGSRRQPLVWYITTADYDRESICNEKYDYAAKVRDGIVDDAGFLPVIYEALREDDWKNPKVWAKANPNLGVSISLEYLERECKRAQDVPAYENTFKRLHLNMRTEQDMRMIPMDKWDACGEPFDEAELIGRECFAGLDLGATSDFTALSLWFPDADGMGGFVLPFFWLPERPRRRDRRMQDQIATWMRDDKWIKKTSGETVDYDQVVTDIGVLSERYPIRELAVDRAFQGAQTCTNLMRNGHNVIDFGQGFMSMAAPCKAFLDMVVSGRLRHGGNPVLRWMASNASAETDAAGSVKFSKKHSGDKIDGLVAAAMAIGRAGMAPEAVEFDIRVV